MPIPTQDELLNPLLRLLGRHEDGVRTEVAYDELANEFALSGDERAEKTPGTGEFLFANKVRFTRNTLARSGYLVSSDPGHWRITQEGKAFLIEHPDDFDRETIRTLNSAARRTLNRDREANDAAEGGPKKLWEAAREVLLAHGKPMHTNDLWAEIERGGLCETSGKTPEASLYTELLRRTVNTTIKDRNKQNVFHRVAPSTFELLESLSPEARARAEQGTGDLSAAYDAVLAGYLDAREKTQFGNDSELAGTFSTIEEILATSAPVKSREHVLVKWSAGMGNWARIPWVALLDDRETTTTQDGTYCVYLFCEDMRGVYLAIGQGVTELKREHGSAEARRILRERAQRARSAMGKLEQAGFELNDQIDLRTSGALGKDYEAGAIAYKFYEANSVPNDNQLFDDLEAALLALSASRTVARTATRSERAAALTAEPSYSFEDAERDVFVRPDALREMHELLAHRKNLILQGPPGVGKTYLAQKLAYLLMGSKAGSRTSSVQFHQSFSYEDFVQGFRPNSDGGFARRNGIFFQICEHARVDAKPHVIIIDEINRGNLSKIFGELMLLLEADKRGEEWAVQLMYSREDEPRFFVPKNVFVIGTMNTADRSLALVDYALRRRFVFTDIEPAFDLPAFDQHLAHIGVDGRLRSTIRDRFGRVNELISADTPNLGPGYRLGHSYFCTPPADARCDRNWYERVVRTEIVPLLREYWFDGEDADKVATARDTLLRPGD